MPAAERRTVVTLHVHLDGLVAGTTYAYEILDGDLPLAAASFATAPDGRAPLRFTAFAGATSPGHWYAFTFAGVRFVCLSTSAW